MGIHTPSHRPSDRRAFWMSLLGGSIAGLSYDRSALRSVLTHQPPPMLPVDPAILLGEVLGCLIVPALVIILSNRRPFLWALLAQAVFLLWTGADGFITGHWRGLRTALIVNGVTYLPFALVFAAPLSLLRAHTLRQRERAHAPQTSAPPGDGRE